MIQRKACISSAASADDKAFWPMPLTSTFRFSPFLPTNSTAIIFRSSSESTRVAFSSNSPTNPIFDQHHYYSPEEMGHTIVAILETPLTGRYGIGNEDVAREHSSFIYQKTSELYEHISHCSLFKMLLYEWGRKKMRQFSAWILVQLRNEYTNMVCSMLRDVAYT